jgi:hypothetical protein
LLVLMKLHWLLQVAPCLPRPLCHIFFTPCWPRPLSVVLYAGEKVVFRR